MQFKRQFTSSLTALILLLGVGGFFLSSYLAWAGIQSHGLAGCSATQVFDCSHVTSSHWSKVMGIPVGILASANYLILVSSALTLSISKNQRLQTISMALFQLTALSAGLAAIWFIALQAVILHQFCTYCLGAHLCGLVLAAVVLVQGSFAANHSQFRTIIGVAASLVLVLAGIQAITPKNETTIHEVIVSDESVLDAQLLFESLMDAPASQDEHRTADDRKTLDSIPRDESADVKATGLIDFAKAAVAYNLQLPINAYLLKTDEGNNTSNRIVTFLGNLRINLSNVPIDGDPAAQNIVLEVFDYTCSHCRDSFRVIEATKQTHPGKLAVITLPMAIDPNKPKAFELSRLSLAVWLADRSKFSEYHRWLIQQGDSLQSHIARAKANDLVGSAKLSQVLQGNHLPQWTAFIRKVFTMTQSQTVPVFVASPNRVLRSQPHSVQQLADFAGIR